MRWDDVLIEAGEIAMPRAMQAVPIDVRIHFAVCSIKPHAGGHNRDRNPAPEFFMPRVYRIEEEGSPTLLLDGASEGTVIGSFPIWFKPAKPNLLLLTGGRPPVLATRVDNKITVDFDPRPVVHLRLAELAGLPAGYRPHVTVIPLDGDLVSIPREFLTSEGVLDFGATLSLAVPQPGHYGIELDLRSEDQPTLAPASLSPAYTMVPRGSPIPLTLHVEGPFR